MHLGPNRHSGEETQGQRERELALVRHALSEGPAGLEPRSAGETIRSGEDVCIYM